MNTKAAKWCVLGLAAMLTVSPRAKAVEKKPSGQSVTERNVKKTSDSGGSNSSKPERKRRCDRDCVQFEGVHCVKWETKCFDY